MLIAIALRRFDWIASGAPLGSFGELWRGEAGWIGGNSRGGCWVRSGNFGAPMLGSFGDATAAIGARESVESGAPAEAASKETSLEFFDQGVRVDRKTS